MPLAADGAASMVTIGVVTTGRRETRRITGARLRRTDRTRRRGLRATPRRDPTRLHDLIPRHDPIRRRDRVFPLLARIRLRGPSRAEAEVRAVGVPSRAEAEGIRAGSPEAGTQAEDAARLRQWQRRSKNRGTRR